MNVASSFGVRFTQSWVGMYTGGLPTEAAERRLLEIESDLHEQVSQTGDDGILGRCLRGMTADVWWRIRTLRENAGQQDGSKLMTVNPMRKWWVGLVVLHIALTAVPSLLTFSDADEIATALIAVSLVGVALMGIGLFVQRTRAVAGSWMILVGLLPVFLSITGIAVLVFGFWSANFTLRKTTLETGYESVAARNQTLLASSWWVWLLAAAAFFGLGWVGLFIDNWYVWILSWGAAIFTAVITVIAGVAAYTSRHRTRAA